MTGYATRFAKVDFLFWRGIEPDHMCTIQENLLPTLGAEPRLSTRSGTVSAQAIEPRTRSQSLSSPALLPAQAKGSQS